jgi:hypothetical protein
VDVAGLGASEDAAITVLDGHDRVKGTGFGHVALDLPPGLYAVQVERAGIRSEEVYRHAGKTELRVGEPKRFSAVPVSDTVTSHEYYQGPAAHWSRTTTTAPLAAAPDGAGSLFVFLRAPSAEAATQLAYIGLSIVDDSGRDLASLGQGTAVSDERTGWLAFNAEAPAGEYALRYRPSDIYHPPARDMAIGVFSGWQTQVFMTLADGPSFPSASVLMGHGFDPDDRVAQAVDAALAGLQNRTDLLLREQRRLLLYGKFDNPMLGLVGAHVLLQARDVDRRQIETVLDNLGWLLGQDAPDVRALRLRASRRLGDPVDTRPFERPPMLRAGLEAILEAAADTPELVPRGGLMAHVAVERFVDSPWSTWRPRRSSRAGEFAAAAPTGPSWVPGYVENAALEAARRDQELDVAKVAARAALPRDTVARAYEQVRAGMAPGAQRTLEMERLMSHVRREARQSELDASEVRSMFFDGDEGDRVRALALMQGDPSVRDVDVALAGIRESRSAFEQYHALRLAQGMLPSLDARQRQDLAGAIAEQRGRGGHIAPGTDRWYLSERILADLGSAEDL